MSVLNVYPTVGGYVWIDEPATHRSWDYIVEAHGEWAASNAAAERARIFSHEDSSYFEQCVRSVYIFDTSALTAGATISAATLRIVGSSKANTFADTFSLGVCSVLSAIPNPVVKGAYELRGNTQYSDTITYDAFNASGNNTFTFNGDGLAAISKTGNTYFCIREILHDLADDVDPTNHDPTWAASAAFDIIWVGSAPAQGASRPLLTVTYTDLGPVSSAPGAYFAQRNFYRGFNS